MLLAIGRGHLATGCWQLDSGEYQTINKTIRNEANYGHYFNLIKYFLLFFVLYLIYYLL